MIRDRLWQVRLSKKADKGIGRLPKTVRLAMAALMHEIEINGPVRGNWPNYGKLGVRRHHCHLKKGKPCCCVGRV
ncbi:MAG: hypothetical protein LBK01_03470 [Burkholderiaceae bacterium]|nr:hypothetical protein [Burkholderiaceae bacterium]